MNVFIALFGIAAVLLSPVAAASADPFSSSHVATLGSDFEEKVRLTRLRAILSPVWSSLPPKTSTAFVHAPYNAATDR